MVNYPAQIDTSISIPRAVDNQTPVASNQYNQSRDAVIAIETELGVKPSATYGTVRARLDYLESIITAGGGVQIAQDLGGLATAPLVIGIYGNPVAPTSPTANYVLTWSGTAWEPMPPSIVGGLHNTLGGLQGGTSSQYYHLTSAQHVWLTDGVTTGYWDVTKGGTGLTTASTGDIFYASAPNTLMGLTIGDDGYVLTASSGVPVWAADSSPTFHNNLNGIQGGSGTDGYYHLTSNQHSWLTDGYSTTYWEVTKGGTGLNTVAAGDLLYASALNTVDRIAIGSEGQVLTVSSGVPTWASDSSPTSHNALTGIQGGSGTDGYYHFTSYEHDWLNDGYTDGYWDETKGGTGYTSYSVGDILYADTTTSLAKLSASVDGYILSLSSGIPTWTETQSTDVTSMIRESSIIEGTLANTGIQETAMESATWDQSNQVFSTNLADDIIYVGNGRFIASTDNIDTGIAVSEDYGKTWRDVSSTAIGTLEYIENGYVFAFDDYNFGNGDLWRSSDYGETWTNLGTGSAVRTATGFVNIGDGNAIVFGYGTNTFSRISKTTDYGSTWTSKYYIATTGTLTGNPVYLGNGIIIGELSGASIGGHRIARSDDYGETWSMIDAGLTAGSANIRRGTVYLGNGIVLLQTDNEMVRSTDYGITWSTITRGANNDGTLVNMGGGVVLGISPSFSTLLFKSTDYGKTWSAATNMAGSNAYKSSAAYGGGVLCILSGYTGNLCYVNRLAKSYDPAILVNTETLGGTGQSSYTTGDILYASGTNTLSVLNASVDGYILSLNGGIPSWQQSSVISYHNNMLGLQGGETDGYYHLTPAQHTWLTDGYDDGYWIISKGGTGITSYSQGDILYADAGGNLTILGVGSDSQVLTANGTLPTWADLPDSVTIHNDLTGIQGGEADGYYHLTPGERQFVIDGYNGGSFTDGYQLSINDNSVEWAPSYYSTIYVGKIGAVAANTDGYLLPNLAISSTEDFPAFITPIQSRACNMRVKMSQAPGAGESVTVTLRKGGVNTVLSITVSESNTSGADTTTLVTGIQAGSEMTMRVETTSGAAVEDLAVILMFYPDNTIL